MRTNRPHQVAIFSCYFYQGCVLTYPKELERIFLTSVSPIHPQAGTQIIREQYISQPEWLRGIDNSKILLFKIENIREGETTPSRIWVYDREGNFLGQHWEREKRFDGRNPEKLRFQKGDLVQFITDFDPLVLQLGIILGVPFSKQKALEINQEMAPLHLDETDNTYAVYSSFGDGFGHYHLPECYLFMPTGIITSSAQERLLGLLVLSQ